MIAALIVCATIGAASCALSWRILVAVRDFDAADELDPIAEADEYLYGLSADTWPNGGTR